MSQSSSVTPSVTAPVTGGVTARLSRKEAARFLTQIGCPLAPRTLANMASNNNAGGGPPFIRIRRRIVVYSEDELRAWALANTRRVA